MILIFYWIIGYFLISMSYRMILDVLIYFSIMGNVLKINIMMSMGWDMLFLYRLGVKVLIKLLIVYFVKDMVWKYVRVGYILILVNVCSIKDNVWFMDIWLVCFMFVVNWVSWDNIGGILRCMRVV